MSAPSTYVPRDSIPNFAGLIAVMIVVLGVTLLSAGYALATLWLPFVNMLTLLAAPALGFGAAMVANKALEVARIRSIHFSFGVMAFAGVYAWYANWVVWIAAVGGHTVLLELGLHPLALAGAIAQVNQTGFWEYWDFAPTGVVLWLLWAIEAALIIGVALHGGLALARTLYERPFCEECRSWIGPTHSIAKLELGDEDSAQLRVWIEAGEWEYFRGRAGADDEDNALQLTVGSCDCGALNMLALERHSTGDGGYGCETVSRDLLVDDEVVRVLGRG